MSDPHEDDYFLEPLPTWKAVAAAAAASIIGLSIPIILAVAIGALLAVVKASAHDAIPTATQPLGWTYDYSCCSTYDCSQVRDDAVKVTKEGYQIAATGELIPWSDKRIKRSKDEFYHRCVPGGKVDAPKSLCLYVPDRGF